jgi:hypothetical protein
MNSLVLHRMVAAGIAVLLLGPSSALAQAPYVSASVGADISRFSGADVDGGFRPGGEALAVSLRAGTRIGEQWGVELGYTRPSTVESESGFNFPFPLPVDLVRALPGSPSLSVPVFRGSTRVERRDSTLETVAWVRQNVGRLDLVYLGGVAFNRTVEEITTNFGRIALLPLPSSVRTTTYGVAPLVGIEGRIGMTDHLRLVVGTRLQSIGGDTGSAGWLVRPSAGLMWQF